MKILINAVSAKRGGAVTYITNLLRHLSAVKGGVQFLVFLPPETAAKLEGLTQNVRLIPTGIGHAGRLRRIVWEQLTLRIFLKRERADALYSTANFAMFCCPVRQLLLVRNALYFSSIYRRMFLPRHSRWYRVSFGLRRWLIIRSARGADVVMTPTQAMLDELRCRVDVKTAMVNPYGVTVAEAVTDETGHRPVKAGDRVVRLLYVSLYSEHKNLSTLLKALALLNDHSRVQFKLVTTADPAWSGSAWTVTYQEDLALARHTGIAEHVAFVGPLNRHDTASLYRTSDICVFPSLTESFGFPLAEAMSYGLPIVAADTPVNREVCGQAAIYFRALSAEDLADRLLNLAMDSTHCARLSARGRWEAARRYSWSTHADRIVEAASSHDPKIICSYRAATFTP